MRPTAAAMVLEGVFDFVARLEVEKSLRLQYPVSFLTIRADAESAIRAPNRLAARLSRVVSALVRSTDLVVVDRKASGTVLHLLLIDAHFDHLSTVIGRIQEEVKRHRFRVNGDRVPVRLAVGAASFPTTASTLAELRTQAGERAATERAPDGANG